MNTKTIETAYAAMCVRRAGSGAPATRMSTAINTGSTIARISMTNVTGSITKESAILCTSGRPFGTPSARSSAYARPMKRFFPDHKRNASAIKLEMPRP